MYRSAHRPEDYRHYTQDVSVTPCHLSSRPGLGGHTSSRRAPGAIAWCADSSQPVRLARISGKPQHVQSFTTCGARPHVPRRTLSALVASGEHPPGEDTRIIDAVPRGGLNCNPDDSGVAHPSRPVGCSKYSSGDPPSASSAASRMPAAYARASRTPSTTWALSPSAPISRPTAGR